MSNGDPAQHKVSGVFCWHWFFLLHLRSILVFAQALKRWMPNMAIFGPFGKGHFAEQYRLEPMDSTPFPEADAHRFATAQYRRFHSNFRETCDQLTRTLHSETGPDFAGVFQRAILFIGEVQRS